MSLIKREFPHPTHSQLFPDYSQMALDGKAIKEEIPDKEVYDSGSVRRAKGELFETRTLINYRGQL